MANKLIKNIAEKGLNYAKPRNQEEKSIQSQNPIARVSLDGKITRINNTKQPIAKVGLDGKITAINRKEKKKKSGFFQGSKYFDDGYDFGDISKTLFWSGADLLQDVTRGFSRTIEGTTDTLGYLSADVLDFFGADDTADWLRDVSKYDVTGKILKPSDYLEQRSVFGNYSDTVFEGVGNVGAMALSGNVMGGSTGATIFNSFSSSYGNSMGEALRNGADLNTARKTALINGTAEAISEQFFDALPGMKVEGWGSKAVGKIGSAVERYFGTNTGKLAMKILNASGEGFEEIISNMLVATGNDIMHGIDKNFTYGMEGQSGNIFKDLKQSATSKESWNAFISASLTSALTNGGNQFISTTQKNNLIKTYAKENNMTVNQAKAMFNQSVQEKTQYQIQQQPKMNLGQRVETENMAKAKTMQELKRGTFVQPGTETDAYQYQETDNEKVNNVRKSLAELNVNNTIQTREMAKTAERLARDLGIDVEFTNNEKLQSQMSEEQKKETQGRVVNGFVDKNTGKMYLNVDSNELANFTIGHETKHFFEANEELNNVLNKALKEYAQLKGRYDEDLARVTKTYTDKNGNLIADPETELMADYVGEFFTDYNFVSNLSTKNPSLFARARDFFQKLYYKATGQKEKLLIKQINDNLNKVYREYAKTQPKKDISSTENQRINDKNIQYSLSKDSQDRDLSEQQQEYFKDSKVRDENGKLTPLYHGSNAIDTTIFTKDKFGDKGITFLTNDEDIADTYRSKDGKRYEFYANIKNPYIVEGNGKNWNDILVGDNPTAENMYNSLTEQEKAYLTDLAKQMNDMYLGENLGREQSIEGFYQRVNAYDENLYDRLAEDTSIRNKIYDAARYNWNDTYVKDLLGKRKNTNQLVKEAYDSGEYDGVIFKNIVDRGTHYHKPIGRRTSDVYVVFNPDQFKLKSNKNPSESNDMRYLLSQEGEDLESYYQDLYPIKNKVTTRLSDLKRKEVELPTEQENNLKTSENEQKQGEKPTRREVIDRNRQLAREQLGDITQIKDKKRGLLYQINTMKRNLRDIMTKEQAQKMYDTYFKDITTNNAKIENDITSYNERIQKYNLNDKESTYTQMIGELKHNPETTLTKQQVDDFYYKNANKIDQQKCENAVNEFRQIYDELIEKVNDVLTDNGYKPIEYRKGYFPHFIEEKATSKLGKLAEKLGWKVKKGQLPTDIAGITDQFKPGKAWTSFSQQRTGDATDYNALKGLDNYLRGAMDVIHHTNDIQKLRALENEIRYQYSSKGVQDKINEIYADENLDMEEKNDAIANLTSNIRESGLGNFVTEIRNYTDNLANKKAFGDRSMEQTLGRDVYSIMNNINGRVSANMVGANISSAITNFIPITQAWSQLSTKNLMRGMYESIKTSIKGDNFADRSTFLTNRTKQAERLYNTKMDKITQKLGVPFEAIDSFTSNTIVRAKYYDNIAKGMSEQEAMANADEFAKDVMAGRSKGDQPTIFNRKNPLFKLFTAFQLEVNNQYGYMFKDIPTNMADEAKRKLVGAFIKMFLGAWLYNEITEKFTGRRAAFDPIDMAVSDVKTLTNEDMDLGDKIQSIVKDTAQEVPFVSGLAGGGRLPIQGAIPYSNPLEMVTKTFEDIGKLDDPKKRKTAINNLKKEWSKPVYYLLFPVAGGQVKKTVEGLSMYDKDLPIAGSYTNSGKLRFEADTSTLGKVQAAVFGQYASKNAREYFKNGYTPLTEGQVEEALEAELPINEYREINQGIKDAKAEAKAKGENQTEAMYDYIYDLPIDMEQKNSLINSRTKGSSTIKDDNGYIKYVDDKGKTYWYDKKNDIVYNNKYKEMDTKDIADLTKASTQKDISNYANYGSLAEFNYSNKNPEKYLALTKIADYDTFMEYKDELAAIKQRYDNKPTEFKKKKVFEYINSLPLSVEQKLMLQKMGAGYSIKQYRGRLHNYINNMDLTKEQKQAIDKVLFD